MEKLGFHNSPLDKVGEDRTLTVKLVTFMTFHNLSVTFLLLVSVGFLIGHFFRSPTNFC
jgi:hypothetical protein